MGLRRAFALTFRTDGMLLFIPWRRRAPRRQPDPHQPPLSFLVDSGSGRRWSSGGRGGRWLMAPARATGSTSQQPDRNRSTVMGLRRAFALTFRTGGMLLFIPWRRRAPRRQPDPHQPPLSFLVEFRIGATMELGRSGRSMADGAGASYGVDVTTPRSQRHTVMGLRRALALTFRTGGMLLFIPWRRRAPRRQTRPAPAAAFLFSWIPDRGDDGARAVGAIDG